MRFKASGGAPGKRPSNVLRIKSKSKERKKKKLKLGTSILSSLLR